MRPQRWPLALALPPLNAPRAQAINAEGTVVTGSAEITPGSGEDLIDIFSPTGGDRLEPVRKCCGRCARFPAGRGATAREFQSSSLPDFAVLNRILPATNGNIAVIDGNVISRGVRTDRPTAGAMVCRLLFADRSPHILIGHNASFDVGSLLLTTLEPDATSSCGFCTKKIERADSCSLPVQPVRPPGSRSIPARKFLPRPKMPSSGQGPPMSEMRGTAFVNGSHAYVAGEVVNLPILEWVVQHHCSGRHCGKRTVMRLTAMSGGPSSTGLTGDNHMIYGGRGRPERSDQHDFPVANSRGFEPAQRRGGGGGDPAEYHTSPPSSMAQIILSANYSVVRTKRRGWFDCRRSTRSSVQILQARFHRPGPNLFLEDFQPPPAACWRLVRTARRPFARPAREARWEGNLLLVGRESAELIAKQRAGIFTISGDGAGGRTRITVLSRSSLGDLLLANAQGGDRLHGKRTPMAPWPSAATRWWDCRCPLAAPYFGPGSWRAVSGWQRLLPAQPVWAPMRAA